MARFKITIAYDGTDFVGWQRQATGRSVQGLIEGALRVLDGRDVAVTGAGRTDAGVHALGQVAACSLAREIDPATLARALNAQLPPDVRVLAAVEVGSAFHPRFSARSKTYRYRIWNGDVVSPFERRYAWHLVGALDLEAMARAARLLEGAHDFAAFQAAGSETRKTERRIFSLRIEDCGLRIGANQTIGASQLIVLEVEGEGFLRHMVRVMVGSLVEVGRGRRAPEWIDDVIGSRDRAKAGPTAPPHGLFLASVDYAGVLADES
ncbi:MAG TPA: tRNA pseudouridine(38-40) synthase TruA [Vicinamibacterales bacterium]|nr:tRNA pseudouridine(38-40) synthase TruA [Vicinamibacterales bacterium]